MLLFYLLVISNFKTCNTKYSGLYLMQWLDKRNALPAKRRYQIRLSLANRPQTGSDTYKFKKLKKIATIAFAPFLYNSSLFCIIAPTLPSPARNLTKIRKVFTLKIRKLHIKLPSLPLFRGMHSLTQRMCSSRLNPYPNPFAYLRSFVIWEMILLKNFIGVSISF